MLYSKVIAANPRVVTTVGIAKSNYPSDFQQAVSYISSGIATIFWNAHKSWTSHKWARQISAVMAGHGNGHGHRCFQQGDVSMVGDRIVV